MSFREYLNRIKKRSTVVRDLANLQKERDKSIDVARGLLMVYIVVFIHGIFWLKVFPEKFSSIFLLEMPAIFAISGFSYSLYEKSLKGGSKFSFDEYLHYIFIRFSRILLPYFVYALACAFIVYFSSASQPDLKIFDVLLAWLNPVFRGVGYSTMMLNLHLWFVAPFLVITAILPFVARIRLSAKIPLVIWALVFCSIMFLIGRLKIGGITAIQTVLFYLGWTIFGYFLSRRKTPFSWFEYAFVFFSAIAAIAFAPIADFNMQHNKTPPNWIFAIFSCCWISFLLMVSLFLNKNWFASFCSHRWLSPYINCGYSIYLWQGIGYSGAVLLAKMFALPLFVTWALAVMISTALGILASPVEKIRLWRRR